MSKAKLGSQKDAQTESYINKKKQQDYKILRKKKRIPTAGELGLNWCYVFHCNLLPQTAGFPANHPPFLTLQPALLYIGTIKLNIMLTRLNSVTVSALTYGLFSKLSGPKHHSMVQPRHPFPSTATNLVSL